jgi:predicted kinase
MLIILSGLPAAGKTTIARELARQLGAVHLRIDSIEQAIRDSGIAAGGSVDDAGYRIGYAVAADNLRLGRTVIADSVNPCPVTRNAWVEVAERTHAAAIEVEITCSNRDEHKRRVERRATDIVGLRLPTWEDVVARDYRQWDRERIVIDTAQEPVEQNVRVLRDAVMSRRA